MLKDIFLNQEPFITVLKDKEIRFLPEEGTTKDDFVWADAFVGFGPSNCFAVDNLKWVHSLGAGVDRFLTERHWTKDIILTRTECSFGQKIAEYCLSYILADLQLHRTFDQLKQLKNWTFQEPKHLKEQKILIFGTGTIGHAVGKLFNSLGALVYGVSLSALSKEGFAKVISLDSLQSIAPDVDIIINTLPLTSQTRNLFDKDLFAKFYNAMLINVGRGASVNETALLDALDNGNLRTAVLDVFNEEPLPRNSLLWSHPRVIVTPHISALTDPYEASEYFLNTLKNIEGGEFQLINQVDYLKGY